MYRLGRNSQPFELKIGEVLCLACVSHRQFFIDSLVAKVYNKPEPGFFARRDLYTNGQWANYTGLVWGLCTFRWSHHCNNQCRMQKIFLHTCGTTSKTILACAQNDVLLKPQLNVYEDQDVTVLITGSPNPWDVLVLSTRLFQRWVKRPAVCLPAHKCLDLFHQQPSHPPLLMHSTPAE